MAFGNQVTGTASASQTIHVAAVTGAGTAVLGPITLSGADAASFSITGGTCLTTNPVHGGATCTITVAFNPATLGPKAARVDVPLNPPAFVGAISGRSVGLTGTGAGAPPAAAATTLAVQFNTATTLNLTPFISGAAPLAVRITAAPANGVATAAGTTVTYTPNLDYVGPDAFSYESFNATAASPVAVVTVTVAARPDPAKDANVVGLIGAQAQAASRFARAQIFNFQRRMESLHFGAVTGNATPAGAAGLAPRRNPAGNPGSGPAMSREAVPGLGANSGSAGDRVLLASSDPLRTARERGAVPELRPASTASDLLPASLATALLSATSTRSLNLSHSSDRADGNSGLPDGTGMWIGGTLRFGTRDATTDSNALRFSTDGVSAGIDRRFSDKLVLGLGLGYARDKTDIGTDGTRSRSSGSSIAAYGSYHPTRNTFVDGLIGYGVLSNDTDRYVAAANDYARGHRKGDQWFGSIAAGYEHVQDGLLLSPYGRLDFANNRLKQGTETGAGANALTYFEQTLPSVQFALGLRAESWHETGFGWASPRLRVELSHDFKGVHEATVAYADRPAGQRYSIAPTGVKRDSLLVGIGSDFIFRNGLKLGIDYQVDRVFGSDSSQLIRLSLAKALDGKGPASGLGSSKLFENPVRVEAGYMWDDNVTRARDGIDKLTDHVYSLNIGKSFIFPVGGNTRVVANGFLSGDKFYTYSGLDRLSSGGQAEFQYRASAEFDAPTFGVFGRASLDVYNSQIRTGYRYSFGITARQSLTDRIDAFGELASNARNTESAVFDARDYSLRVNLDYSLGRSGTPYFSGEYRRGDTVSTGRRSIDSIAIAKSFVQDDAYGSTGQRFAYRFEAKTVLWTVGYNWPLGPRDSLDFSWRRAQSTSTQLPNYALAASYGIGGAPGSGTSRYIADQYSIAYLMRF